MRPSVTLAFSKLEDFAREVENEGERFQRDLEQRVAKALEQGYQRGFEAGRIEAEAIADQTIGDLKVRYEKDAIAAQLRWHLETGNRLAESLEAQFANLSETLEGEVASILKPIVTNLLYRQAVQDFHEAVDSVLLQGVTVEIRGPEELVRGIEQRIGVRADYISAVTSNDAEIRVKCSETTVSANFASWIGKLEESLA